MDKEDVVEKNEIMPSATTWMDLEMIILSEISQTEKDMIPHDITRYHVYMETQK